MHPDISSHQCNIPTLYNKKLNTTQPVEVIKKPSYHYKDDFIPRMTQEDINYPILFPKLKNKLALELPTLNQTIDRVDLKIPSITHKIYLFKDGSTKSLSENNIQKIIRTSNGLNEVNKDYKHYFWTNNPANIDSRIKDIKNLKIVDFSEFSSHKVYEIITNHLNNANIASNPVPSLTQASDVLREIIMQKYGGTYHDVDYEIFNPKLYNIITQKYPLIVTQESSEERDIANFFIAATPGHPVINATIDIIHRNYYEPTPQYIIYPIDPANQLVYKAGPCALSAAFFKSAQDNPTDDNYLFFIEGGLTNHQLARSTEPLNENCKNEGNIPDFYFQGQYVPTIGADTMCGSWADAEGFNKPLEYYSVVLHPGLSLECGQWDELPKGLESSDYSLSLDGEDYICGFS